MNQSERFTNSVKQIKWIILIVWTVQSDSSRNGCYQFTVMNQSERFTNSVQLTIWIILIVWTGSRIMNKWLSKWFPWISHESVEKTHKQSQTHNLNQSDDYSVNSGVWLMNKWLSKRFTVMNQSKRLTKILKRTIWISLMTTVWTEESQFTVMNQSERFTNSVKHLIWIILIVWTVESESWTNDSLNDSLVMNQSKRLTNSPRLTIWISLMTTVESDSWTNDSLTDSL